MTTAINELVPPSVIKGESLRKWEETIERLEELGIIGITDATALTRYCVEWEQWLTCQEQIRENGLTMDIELEGQGTITKSRPEFSMSDKLANSMKRFEDSMGMNASSRIKMKVHAQKVMSNPIEDLQNAMR